MTNSSQSNQGPARTRRVVVIPSSHHPVIPSSRQGIPSPVRSARLLLLAATLLVGLWSGGCSAVSNPVEDAIPVNRLPPEILGKRKDEEKTIPLNLLRQKQPDVYRLGPGDILGVYIEGILPVELKQSPPVNLPEPNTGVQPTIGFPIPVQADGTIALPNIVPLKVEGRSIPEVQADIFKAYTTTKPEPILKPETARILIALIKPRQYHVLVVRQDSGGLTVGATGGLGQTKRGTGYVINLPAYENDVLNALARTGGLPGLDAENQVTVERGSFQNFDQKDEVLKHVNEGSGSASIRIPLRLRPDEPIPFKPEDVILNNGDIVFIEARDTEVFYTGGLLPPKQFVLPRDYDLDVVEAVMFAAGPILNGNISQNNLSGNLVQPGIGFPSPSLVTILRHTPNGRQIPIRVSLNEALRDRRQRVLIQAGDIIILQETPEETIVRYITSQLHLSLLGTIISQQDLVGTTTLSIP